MKKCVFGLMLAGISSVYALTVVNFATANYRCNGKLISPATSESALLMNCNQAKLVEHDENTAGRNYRGPGGGALTTKPNVMPSDEDLLDKVKFYTDDASYMVCYYNDHKFVKCKVKAKANPKPQAS